MVGGGDKHDKEGDHGSSSDDNNSVCVSVLSKDSELTAWLSHLEAEWEATPEQHPEELRSLVRSVRESLE